MPREVDGGAHAAGAVHHKKIVSQLMQNRQQYGIYLRQLEQRVKSLQCEYNVMRPLIGQIAKKRQSPEYFKLTAEERKAYYTSH